MVTEKSLTGTAAARSINELRERIHPSRSVGIGGRNRVFDEH
jgi:hypothetical protein